MRKIASLDTHVALACTGLKADVRVLINLQAECREPPPHRRGPPPSVHHPLHRRLQQKYTQRRSPPSSPPHRRLRSRHGQARLYCIDLRTFSAWKANATGRNSNSMREFLEKNYKDTSGKETIELTIRALLEICVKVESSFSRFLYGDQARFFNDEIRPELRHSKTGTIAMASAGENCNASQFYITLRDDVDYLDYKHTVFGTVAEGLATLTKINEAYVDDKGRPFKDIRIKHTYILDDPFDDPP
ncbi:hypothetical protein ZWY2020_037650 [Hordeum vulgare]|nr:hypothetical protein ZWY2020_037650 [Hordeum vulgare]